MALKNTFLLLGVCCTILLIVALIGCKRKELVENSFTRIVKRWKLIRSATDDNGNGTIDDYEYHYLTEDVLNYYTFKADSSGQESVRIGNGTETLFPYIWGFDADSLIITRVGNNRNVYYIKNLSNVTLEIYLPTVRGPVAYFFEPG